MKKIFETKYGSFSNDGKEYIIKTPRTPKPWINVISNGDYGFVVSQTGSGFSWKEHSEFNRITRWHQDMIQDNWGKYIFIKNNITGDIWSPTWMPLKTELDEYKCIHGVGYTIFESSYKNIKMILTLFVPVDENIELWSLKLINDSNENVDLSVYTYFEWCLGSSNDYHREFHKLFLETEFSNELNGIIAKKRLWDIPLGDRGHWNIDYPYLGFFTCNKRVESYDGSKESFIGQYGSINLPNSLKEKSLKNNFGKFNDSIASLKIDLKIQAGDEDQLIFNLGLNQNEKEIKKIISQFDSNEKIETALKNVKNKWSDLLADLEINTPDKGMNMMVNTWLRYQAISGRLWGRTALYQQSGAFGFRDQLQDSLVYLPTDPELTKQQILLHARHQMYDGSVLHWWHPISETGLKTEMTDDLLWLPYITSHYIDETDNYSILNIEEPYYESEDKTEPIYMHCCKAIDKVLSRRSNRGLPLIGEGDWNDGLSALGLEMRGESIWLAQFLYTVLIKFSKICNHFNQKDKAEEYLLEAENIESSFNKYAWDGEWFFRGTKDSGEKIGSKENTEGKIFLNPQVWSVISGITTEDKMTASMNSVTNILLKKNGPLLLYPAYSKSDKYIGYLSRYASGKRENGGVYSHAATWAIWAYALLGDSENAFEVFKRLCPIYSGMNPDEYVAEPYVMPGNIDGPDSPNYGMAGWTWYTGSASWFQKVIVDFIIGVRATSDGLLIDPHIPKDWDNFLIKRKFRGVIYNIEVNNPGNVASGVAKIVIDGKENDSNLILASDKGECRVEVFMGKDSHNFNYISNAAVINGLAK